MEALANIVEMPLASIIVNNYNYGRFLKQAVDSALRQTYPRIEVIVVDDGSTDNSREIVATYGNRIISVLKENGGQGSAFNAGFAASHGDIIFFLDSDDQLLPTAVEKARSLFCDSKVVKAHWPLWEIDASGNKTGKVIPEGGLAEGEFREVVIQNGPFNHANPPTSGNAWSRRFLDCVFPIPERDLRIGADQYLMELAPLFGTLKRLPEPQALYRVHGRNQFAGKSFDETLAFELELYDSICAAAGKYCSDMRISVDAELWKRKSWFHQLRQAAAEMATLIPAGRTFILIDENQWGLTAGNGRDPICLPNREEWENCENNEIAIQEFEDLRQAGGAGFLVFGWPAFWWFEHYDGLNTYLRGKYPRVLENERLVVFDLQASHSL